MGETPEQQGLDNMWDNRIWVHILYRIVTAFHVLHQGLGPKLVNQHLSDGREWLLGGDQPTFSDITMATAIAFSKFPVNATPLDKRFEHIDAFWQRWQRRPTFLAAYADRSSGVPELDNRL